MFFSRLIDRIGNFDKLFISSENDYYIDPQTLPPLLTEVQEKEAIELLRTDEKRGREMLITHNLRLVVYIAKELESTGICIDDMISIGTVGLIKAVDTFLPYKSISFTTYASRCIQYEILMFLKKVSQHKNSIPTDEHFKIEWSRGCKCE